MTVAAGRARVSRLSSGKGNVMGSMRGVHIVMATALLGAASAIIAGEVLIMDKAGTMTRADHGFWQDIPPKPASANVNLKSPVDYSTGTVYTRVEVRSMPSTERFMLQMQICQYKADGTGPYYGIENCGAWHLVPAPTASGPGLIGWSWNVQDMWKMDGVPIDWSRSRSSHAVVVWTPDGKNISDYSIPGNPAWGGVNPDSFFPMTLRFTCVLVSKGSTFSGWQTYFPVATGVRQEPLGIAAPAASSPAGVYDLRGRLAADVTRLSPAFYAFPPGSGHGPAVLSVLPRR
jgi:hypothetical protein